MVAKELTKPVRGKDRGKLMEKLGDWVDPVVVGEFAGDHKLLYLPHPDDLALLGSLMHHCSGTHFIWASEEKIWYFFAVVDKNNVPIATLHTKEEKWLNKSHPRDNGKGVPPIVSVSRSGGYPIRKDYVEAFKKAGLKYEPGIYKPLNYASTTYDYGTGNGYDDARTFSTQFRNPIPRKPDGVSTELFNNFVHCWKAMEDHYNKTVGVVKISGRTFWFDGKKQIVLSLSGGAQVNSKTGVRQMVALQVANVQV